jgi:hypothetical protein
MADLRRSRGHRGGVIPMHRALAHFHLRPMNLVTAVSLFLLFSYLWFACLPRVCQFWSRVFKIGIQLLPLRAELGSHRITSSVELDIPFLRLDSVLPGARIWWLTCAVTILLFVATYFLSQRWTPVVYLVRGILFVQATALLYFALRSAHFPHTSDSYMEGLVASAIGLISAVPALYGLIYYIFDFGLLRKALLTTLTMAHLTLFLPFQVLLQALVLQKTVLFMPLLYIVFGLPVDILLIIALYSWGMTWPFRGQKKDVRSRA